MGNSSEYAANKAFVTHCWERYAEKNDPRWLAEICLKLPFFEHPHVGQEIAKRLSASFWENNAIDEHVIQKDVWRLWEAWQGSDKDVVVRQRIADVFFINDLTGEPDEGGAERVRGIIRKFKKMEK